MTDMTAPACPPARVLVAERISAGGLDLLRVAGHEVDVRLRMNPAELIEAVAGAQALIVP